MQVVFTMISQASELELEINPPQNNHETALVTYAQTPGYCVVFIGRLYYQDERIARLRPHIANKVIQECQSNTAELILATYRQFGSAALERLEGDFAFVLWDAQKAELLGVRDPLGGYPLFWVCQGDTIAFSTSIYRLLRLLPQPSLQPEYLADFLMMLGPQNEVSTERCVYKDINRVLPGTIVSAYIPSSRVTRRAYWDWSQQIREPDSSDFSEVVEQYADILQTAVQERLQGQTLAHLSGGMDSTSVALLARKQIRAGFGKKPLHTLSLVYNNLPILARERSYIESVLQNETEIVAHQLVADELLDFDSFSDPPLHDEPYAGLWRLAMDRSAVEVASQVGATTLLTGMGSDEIHDLLPYHLSDLIRQGRFLRAWQEATQWARVKACNPWEILQPFGFAPLISALFPEQPYWQSGKTELNKQEDWTIPSWVRQDFAQDFRMQDRANNNARDTYRFGNQTQTNLSITLNMLAGRAGDVLRWSVAAPLGIAIAHPFLDSRVLGLGLGIQQRISPEPGQMKPILAAAMRDLLPSKIINRKRKGHFNEIYYLGLAKNAHCLEEMVHKSPIDELAIFHIAIAHPFLDSRVLGLGLGIQQRISPEPGQMKPILAAAMRDLLPSKIINRKRKGHFNEIYYLGLAKNAHCLEEMVHKSPIDELAIFHKEILIQAIQEASLGVVSARQLQRLDFSLCLIKWLSLQKEWRLLQEPAGIKIRIPQEVSQAA